MHRFGRSGQLKKDRWGGSFILVAGLALAGAWYFGTYLSNNYGNKPTSVDPGITAEGGLGLGTSTTSPIAAQKPAEFNLYAVQVGAFDSPTGAQNKAMELNNKGEVGFANVNTKGRSFAYAGGLYTDKKAATAYLEEMKKAEVIKDGFVATLKVPYGPEAITAMAGTEKSKVQDGYSSLNTYLHEVALWVEGRASGKDPSATEMVSLGKSLGKLATDLEKANLTDEKLKQFVAVAKEAGAHAVKLEAAASTMDTSKEYMTALSDYVRLLSQYNSLQSNTTAANQ